MAFEVSTTCMKAILRFKASLEEFIIINTLSMRNCLRYQKGKSSAAKRKDGRKNMIGPSRPLFVLFGSSIVQASYDLQGWGASLANLYSRKADIFLRGYSGWNSRRALDIYKKIFPKDAEIQPSLVILYFGGNDSADPEFPLGASVPLDEYVQNMRKIALHIKGWNAFNKGSEIVFNKIKDVITKAEWEPSLDWNKMPNEFADIYW